MAGKRKPQFKRAVITVDFCVELPLSITDEEIEGLMIGGKLTELSVQLYRKDAQKLEKVDAKFVDGYETMKSTRVI